MVESELRRENDHNRICMRADFLSEKFSTLFPTTAEKNAKIQRVKLFSKIISVEILDLSDRNMARHIEEFDNINARTSKIKIIDSLIKARLIKEESRGIYKKTSIGEAAWQSLLQFLDTYEPIEDQVVEDGGKIYEYVYREVNVDEDLNFFITVNQGIRNLSTKNLNFIENTITNSKEKYKGIFEITHSESIKNYEITLDEDNIKKFKLNFAKPLKKGEYIELWFKFNWRNAYLKEEKNWHYDYDSKKSMVKEFMLRYNLPKNYELDAESIKIKINGGSVPKDCQIYDPVIINNGKTIFWRIRKVYPRRRYTIFWDRK